MTTQKIESQSPSLRRYYVKPTVKDPAWAWVIIDTESGMFSTVSDYGSYSYLWTNPGCEFRKFLVNCDKGYFWGKLTLEWKDSEKHVFCSEETEHRINKYLDGLLEEHKISGEQYVKFGGWSVNQMRNDECLEDWVDEVTSSTHETDLRVYPGELRGTKPEIMSWNFVTKLLPRIQQLIKQELEQEK